MKLLDSPSPQQQLLERSQVSQDAHPVVKLPRPPTVLDLSQPEASFEEGSLYTVGKYNELRPSLYQSELFTGEHQRCIHMGVDIGAPCGSEVYAWADGVLYAQGALLSEGDYGHSIVTQHTIEMSEGAFTIWCLHGHLSAQSIKIRAEGDVVKRGDLLGFLGASTENGGWPPHLHFQISWRAPEGYDMPGVVSHLDHERGLWTFPDPRLVLGDLY